MNQRIWVYLWSLGYVLFAVYATRIPRLQNPEFTRAALIIFGLLYVLPNLLFGVSLDIVDDGIRVRRHTDKTIPFQEIDQSFGFFLFPLQLVVARTKLRFPNNLLIAADEPIPHSRFSLLRRGVKASELRFKLAQVSRA